VDAMPKTLDDAIDRARKFAAQPAVAAELSRAKTPSAQHVYNAIPTGPIFSGPKPTCKLFAMGKCRFGEKCKFSHLGIPKPLMNHAAKPRSDRNTVCSFCKKVGHPVRRCVSKFLVDNPKETPPRPITRSTSLIAASEETPKIKTEEKTPPFEFMFVLDSEPANVSKPESCENSWVIDSGATTSATFSEKDCIDVVPCHVVVSAAGGSFVVTKKGTAKFAILSRDGQLCNISITNTLISDKFPYRLWSLQAITERGGCANFRIFFGN